MEVPTPQPVEKNVFKRLFKADPKNSHKTPTADAEDTKKLQNKTLPVKGRSISSKFSGAKLSAPPSKPEVPMTKKPFLIRTPAKSQGTTTRSKAGLKVSLRIKVDKTPPSVRLARNKLQSARYWLSLIDVAEKAGKHAVAMGLFQLAIDSGAQPLPDVEKSKDAYKKRYRIGQAAKESQEDVAVELSAVEARTDVQPVSTPTIQDAVERGQDTGSENCQQPVVASVKNLYQEEYSQIPVCDKDNEVESQNELDNKDTGSSEVVNSDIDKDAELQSKERTTPPPRRTPRRACAMRAALKMEESAKKQSRRKVTDVSGVENMDVNTLMKQVVSGVLSGTRNVVEDPEQEIFSKQTVLGSGSSKNKAEEVKKVTDSQVSGTRKASASSSSAATTSLNSKKAGSNQGNNEFEVVNEAVKWDKRKRSCRTTGKTPHAETNKTASTKDITDKQQQQQQQTQLDRQSETPIRRKKPGRDDVKQAATPGTVELRRSARLVKLTSQVN